jgi:hypothetical protein
MQHYIAASAREAELLEPHCRQGSQAMTYRVASDITGTVLAGMGRRVFRPHLICSWTLDPASQRLSCAWAAPVEELDVASLSSRIAPLSVVWTRPRTQS